MFLGRWSPSLCRFAPSLAPSQRKYSNASAPSRHIDATRFDTTMKNKRTRNHRKRESYGSDRGKSECAYIQNNLPRSIPRVASGPCWLSLPFQTSRGRCSAEPWQGRWQARGESSNALNAHFLAQKPGPAPVAGSGDGDFDWDSSRCIRLWFWDNKSFNDVCSQEDRRRKETKILVCKRNYRTRSTDALKRKYQDFQSITVSLISATTIRDARQA